MKIKKITRDEIVKRLENNGSMIIVEALPEKYYRKGHLPGAVNIPHDEIEQLAPKLILDRQASIAVYCASLTCENSGIAAKTLVDMGYGDVSHYEEGKQGWKEAGLELVSNKPKGGGIKPIKVDSTDYGALLLRLALGLMWTSHALLKWYVFTLPGFAQWLDGKGLPGFMAWPVFLMEISGGTAIILGFFGRYVSLLLLPIITAATLTHLPNGWVFTNAGGGWEYPVFIIVASLAHSLLGDGPIAVSSLLKGSREVAGKPNPLQHSRDVEQAGFEIPPAYSTAETCSC